VTILMGTVILIPFYALDLAIEKKNGLTWNLLPSIVYVAIFPSIFAYWAWNFGVKNIGAATTGLFICFIPVFTALLAAFFLDERLFGYHLVGLVLVASGIFLVHKYRASSSLAD